jgi:hypothetical protein
VGELDDSITRINRVALVIPIHPKHYDVIYNLIDKMYENKNVMDIFLVFSSDEDYGKFERKDKVNKIVLLPGHKTDCIVTYKKFFALEQLRKKKKYDYFIVCDAEISIIPENFNEENILKKIEKIYENKIVYAGGKDLNEITKESANLFREEDRLKKLTKDFTLYYWWSDLPTYKREHLKDFFSKIDYSNINWSHFDHLIYLNYLILYHKFRILNITPILNWEHSLESYFTEDINMLDTLKDNKYGFSWATPKLFNVNKDYLLKEGAFLLYHLDRN